MLRGCSQTTDNNYTQNLPNQEVTTAAEFILAAVPRAPGLLKPAPALCLPSPAHPSSYKHCPNTAGGGIASHTEILQHLLHSRAKRGMNTWKRAS